MDKETAYVRLGFQLSALALIAWAVAQHVAVAFALASFFVFIAMIRPAFLPLANRIGTGVAAGTLSLAYIALLAIGFVYLLPVMIKVSSELVSTTKQLTVTLPGMERDIGVIVGNVLQKFLPSDSSAVPDRDYARRADRGVNRHGVDSRGVRQEVQRGVHVGAGVNAHFDLRQRAGVAVLLVV